MLLHLQCLIDGRELILSYLIVLLKWGVSRLTEGATKERRKRRHQLEKKEGGGKEGTWEINTSRQRKKPKDIR